MNVRWRRLNDGRYLIFYDFTDGDWKVVSGAAPDPRDTPRIGEDGASELRWNPLLGEWLVTATHRHSASSGLLPFLSVCRHRWRNS
jgi:hypothetical protein